MYHVSNMIFSCACLQGALTGGILGFSFNLWLSIGAMTVIPYTPHLPPVSTQGCTVSNTSLPGALGTSNDTWVIQRSPQEYGCFFHINMKIQ